MYCLMMRNATAGSVVVPDFEITTVATLRSATRSISSAIYSSERLFPAKTISGAPPLSASCFAKECDRASRAHFAPRYEPPIPITTTRSTPFFFQSSRMASHSAMSDSGVCDGRCFHPRKSFPAPVSSSRTLRASTAFCVYFLTSAAFTKEPQPPIFTFNIMICN